MYEAKTTGFLELLMNALSLPRSGGSSHVRRTRPVSHRYDPGLEARLRASATAKEIYIEAARLSRWNR